MKAGSSAFYAICIPKGKALNLAYNPFFIILWYCIRLFLYSIYSDPVMPHQLFCARGYLKTIDSIALQLILEQEQRLGIQYDRLFQQER